MSVRNNHSEHTVIQIVKFRHSSKRVFIPASIAEGFKHGVLVFSKPSSITISASRLVEIHH